MRLVMCDSNRILCEALAAALETSNQKVLQVATTANDCLTAIASYRPDACVLDLKLPAPEDGLRAVREIRARYPGMAVLVMSDLRDPDTCAKARRLGIAGLLCKDRS